MRKERIKSAQVCKKIIHCVDLIFALSSWLYFESRKKLSQIARNIRSYWIDILRSIQCQFLNLGCANRSGQMASTGSKSTAGLKVRTGIWGWKLWFPPSEEHPKGRSTKLEKHQWWLSGYCWYRSERVLRWSTALQTSTAYLSESKVPNNLVADPQVAACTNLNKREAAQTPKRSSTGQPA